MSLRDLPEGGNWEGGYRDERGRIWLHEPNVGWKTAKPFFVLGKRQPWWRRLCKLRRR